MVPVGVVMGGGTAVVVVPVGLVMAGIVMRHRGGLEAVVDHLVGSGHCVDLILFGRRAGWRRLAARPGDKGESQRTQVQAMSHHVISLLEVRGRTRTGTAGSINSVKLSRKACSSSLPSLSSKTTP